jgi:hypothetical protein
VTAPRLDVYEIAYLAGGPERVVDTAVVALVESGRVGVPSPGQLVVVDPARRHAVEGAVLDAIGTRGHRSLDLVLWRLVGDDRLRDVGRRLVAEGLAGRRRTLRRSQAGPPIRTAAGRRLLRALVADPPIFSVHDGGSAVQVALHGRQGMQDERLRASIFDAPRETLPTGAAGLRRRISTSRHESPYDSPHAAFDGDAGGGFGGGDGGGF